MREWERERDEDEDEEKPDLCNDNIEWECNKATPELSDDPAVNSANNMSPMGYVNAGRKKSKWLLAQKRSKNNDILPKWQTDHKESMVLHETRRLPNFPL